MASVQIVPDEISEKIDELHSLCEIWANNRKRGLMPQNVRAAIVMTAQEIAALVRVMEQTK